MIQAFACGAYGWFQQALIRLCVCAAVALFVVLVLRTQPVRDAAARIAALWRGAAYWMRLVAMSLVFGFVLYAGTKTNSPPLGMMMPPLPQSGARCKRRARSGARYCKQHSADVTPRKAPERCRSMTENGGQCSEKPVPGNNYCEKHLKSELQAVKPH